MNFIEAALLLSTPLILAALAGYLSERSGVINIALEGNMITATIFGAWVGVTTHNPGLALLGGVGAAMVMSLIHYALTQLLSIEQVVSGMACNAVALGLANVIDRIFKVSEGHQVSMPPVQVFAGFAVVLPFVAHVLSRNTRVGLRLLASGGDPDKARQMGVEPLRIRIGSLALCGALCGLSGCFMVANAGYFTEGMTAGRGYIALAALILGGWRPIPSLIACLVFGAFQALQIVMQGVPVFGFAVPREVWYSLPYLVTVIALAGAFARSKAPAGLGQV